MFDMSKCSICRKETPKDEMVGNICQECATSKLHEDDYDVGMDDFS